MFKGNVGRGTDGAVNALYSVNVRITPGGGCYVSSVSRSVRDSVSLTAVAITIVAVSFTGGSVFADGWNPTTKAPNIESIAKTRHNLTVAYSPYQIEMNGYRNDYREVCVYCHTPHGANTQVNAPLWNRTINTGTYTIYDKPRTLNQPIGQPGPNSLTCLSCHDGTISPDSIINMPGSGGYNPVMETVNDQAWLDRWVLDGRGLGPGPGLNRHLKLDKTPGPTSCMACHNPNNFLGAPDFTVFSIQTDLRDDHPIGILFPQNTTQGGVDFNTPTHTNIATVSGVQMPFFDRDGDGRIDTNEVRLYDTGDGPEVECASCHDPHGIPSGGPGTKFNPSFLRVNNGVVSDGTVGTSGIVSDTGSALCLTCHEK